jgi:SAM-dependent methyltransferase
MRGGGMSQETGKARSRRQREGYFDWIFVGRGIDIGCGDDPVTPDCVPWDREQGDAQELAGVPPASFDWVYSSHCLEHLPDPWRAVARWWEVLRPGGRLLIVVPDEDLYEQGAWPSRYNPDHKRTFTIHKSWSWSPVSISLAELVASLPGHQVRWLRTCDDGYDYSGGVWDRTGGPGEAHIEALVLKLRA